ncbi:hypothetical protein L7F22_065437 [Adiantum nelumboides]|nr:hypothetical protein [Adiantum nelumboides]
MGSKALQVIAPVELPLVVRLKRNAACLRNLYDAKIDEHAQQSVVLTRLCNQVSSLKEMLNLPPCVSTRLNEVFISAIEVLGVFCSGTTASSHSISENHNEISPLFQLLYSLYRSLGAIEADLLLMKATRKVLETLHCSEIFIGPSLQDSREPVARKRSFDDQSAQITPTGSASRTFPKPFIPKPHITVMQSRLARLLPDDSCTLEMLGHKILKKLERITNHLIYEVEQDADMTEPDSLSCFQNARTPSLEGCISIYVSPLSDNLNAGAQMQALEVSKRSSSHLCSSELCPSILQDNSVVLSCESLPSRCESFAGQSNPSDAQQALGHERDMEKSATMPSECFLTQSNANISVFRLANLPTATKLDKEVPTGSCTGIKRLPLIPITNNQAAPASTGKPSLQVLYPPPLPPPPAPLQQHSQRPQAMPPPPPPPPPPSFCRAEVVKILPSHSAKIKKSATLSRLYMAMKKKVEGVAFAPSYTVTDTATQRRGIAGVGTREGMAEAHGRAWHCWSWSEYFRKIEDDVSKHASSILYVKSQLETFETHDMKQLMRFHRNIEALLEQLTDESQVRCA